MNETEWLLYQSLRNVHLLEKSSRMTVASDLLGLQAQFSANPRISLQICAEDFHPERWDEGLVKIWSHRGTMHVIPEQELGLHLAALDLLGPFTEGCWALSCREAQTWSAFLQREVAAGNCTRDGLKRACSAAGMDEELSRKVFYGWGGLIREMVVRGMITCGTGTDKSYRLPPETLFPSRNEARLTMLRRYFSTFGPATAADCRYFFGNWPKVELSALLEAILPELNEQVLDGKKYYSAKPCTGPDAFLPECVLIPGFDQLILAYRDRSRMIDREHLGKLTNISGIIYPSVLVRGRIRARWKLDGNGVTVVPFERLLKKDQTAICRKVRETFGIPSKNVVFE